MLDSPQSLANDFPSTAVPSSYSMQQHVPPLNGHDSTLIMTGPTHTFAQHFVIFRLGAACQVHILHIYNLLHVCSYWLAPWSIRLRQHLHSHALQYALASLG